MDNFPGLRFGSVIDDYREHGDALILFTNIYRIIRPRKAADTGQAIANHLALLELLEQDAERHRLVRKAFADLITRRRVVSFLADSGILPPTGFFSELMRIISHRVLPEIPDQREFRDCMHIILHRQDDWIWMGAIPFENSIRFWRLMAPNDELGREDKMRLFEQMLEAMLLLAYRIGGLDMDQEFHRLGDSLSGYSAAFHAVAGEAQRYADIWRAAAEKGETPAYDERHLLVLIDQCQSVIDRAHRAAMRVGTSLSLTFSLRRSTQTLKRLEILTALLGEHWREKPSEETVTRWTTLVRKAVRAENQRNNINQHVSRGMSLLALRVTDNAAHSGEHYVTETRSAYFSMWRSAMGAGAIIAILALFKIFASKLDLALVGYAFFYSMIYGLGFVLIYMLHLTIATKQPAMTAQTIAGYLGEAERGKQAELNRLVDLIAAVSRSQIAAIIGNVAVALPTAIVVALTWQYLSDTPMIDPGKGAHLLDELSIVGWALPHAAIAGVFLFFSGIISGYFDNLSSYSRIGDRVSRLHWLKSLVGKAGAARVGSYVDAHLGGISGNFLFGCMLGSAGTIGVILGLPIDIRHIAFAAANLGYALTAFNFELPWVTLAWASMGVLLIGFVNLAVSFSLALWMALRAREVAFKQTRGLLRTLWARLKSKPHSFIAAPVDKPGAEPV